MFERGYLIPKRLNPGNKTGVLIHFPFNGIRPMQLHCSHYAEIRETKFRHFG